MALTIPYDNTIEPLVMEFFHFPFSKLNLYHFPPHLCFKDDISRKCNFKSSILNLN
jgi:hypothetical protein